MTRWTMAILKNLKRIRSKSQVSRPSKTISIEALESRDAPAVLSTSLSANELALSMAPVQAEIYRLLQVAGPLDLSQSTLTVTPSSIPSGGTATVRLTARDASGLPLTTGGAEVDFELGTGTANGTFGIVTDHGNGTYSAVFTATTAGTDTITAIVDGEEVAQRVTITVTAGAISPARATVAVSPASIQSGATSTVTLTARDANNNPLGVGGATVSFALGSGTAQGTFSSVTDNNNGTYTATFTGTTAGTNTITATVNGTAITTTAPTITVVGAVDPSDSTVAVNPASIQSGGTSTVTLTARDSNGAQLLVGGATVTFGLGNGTAQGTFGTVTDNNNGTYTAVFTGSTSGTNTVTATINGQLVTTTAPTITVVGSPTAAQSTVTVNPASIQSGGTTTVTLTARDANGVQVPTGGATVTFGLGAGTAQGTFGNVTDNNNGTYTAVFTGTTAGTNTITATINGAAVTSQLPTITVVGTVDVAQSSVAVNPATIQNTRTSTVTLTARDANGNQLLTGSGLTVAFSLGNGTAQGTFGTVTNNGDGTFSATFTASTVGTNTVTATINGQALTSAAPTVTVVAAADPAQSTVALNPTSVEAGSTSTVTLTTNDASGNPVAVGGSVVTFGLGAGTAQGSFGTVTDNGDGTYTAVFTGTTAGTNTVIATINGQAVTSTAPTITVTPGDVSLSQSSVALNPTSIESGSTSTVTLTARDAGGNQLATGGDTILFDLGAGTAQGSFSVVTDNGDGTYTAVLTGTTPGTNTVTATINGQAVTSTAPTITVTPGDVSLSQSSVALIPTSIESGSTSTVTLTARDASGNQLATGGDTILFDLGAGTAEGTFSAVTDNGDGTYTAVFTGTTAGTNTVTATINGQALTSAAPTITVTPGDADPAATLISLNPDTILSGGTSTVTLTAFDANGNQLTTGGSTVEFDLGAGTADGTFAAVTDNNDGTYTSVFTASVVGTNTVTATIDGVAVTSAVPTLTVN